MVTYRKVSARLSEGLIPHYVRKGAAQAAFKWGSSNQMEKCPLAIQGRRKRNLFSTSQMRKKVNIYVEKLRKNQSKGAGVEGDDAGSGTDSEVQDDGGDSRATLAIVLPF